MVTAALVNRWAEESAGTTQVTIKGNQKGGLA